MSSYSIPNATIITNLSKAARDMRSRIDAVSTEAVTGRRSDLAGHLKGEIGNAMLSQKAVDDIATQREQLTLQGSRLTATQASLAIVGDAIGDLSTRMLSETSTGTALAKQRVSSDAGSALDAVFSALNSRLGQRYLFAGDATASPALDTQTDLVGDIQALAATAETTEDFTTSMDAYFEDADGPWRQAIYQGTDTKYDPDAVAANDPAIVGVIKHTAVLAAGSVGPNALGRNTEQILRLSAESLGAAQTALVDLRADVGVSQSRVSNGLEALEQEETIVTEIFNTLTARDQYEAATELLQLQTNLEATYVLTSRLSGLSLVNYLR